MKKFIAIFKNKEIVRRIVFTIAILAILRIGAQLVVPGVTVTDEFKKAMDTTSAFSLMNMLGGGALQNFSVFALGVSPYITSQIIIQLLSKDVLPALSELTKQGEQGRRKIEMATRYLTLMLGAVQAYGIIMSMENSNYVTVAGSDFWTYAYIIIILLAGTMLTMWLGDQITQKGLGNGISVIIFAGIVVNLPRQIGSAFMRWVSQNANHGNVELVKGVLQFSLYIVVLLLIVAFVVFTELAKRKIPVQNSGKSGGQNPSMTKASFLPIKLNSAGVIPVIFASSIMMAPSVIASFISSDAANAEWLKIFSYSETFTMPWFNGQTWEMPWGLLIYLVLIVLFTFFYSSLQINPPELAENFQKNGSYIPGITPGKETERYVAKVLNRVTCIGAIALLFIAALPVVITLTKVFGNDSTLALGGTGLIIVVGVALEINTQIDGLLAGKSIEQIQQGGRY